MATAQVPPGEDPPRGATAGVAPRRSDRSPWHWLLLIPIIVPLIVPIYDSIDPKFGGWPMFYWLQLVFIALGVGTTLVVYWATRRSPEERAAAERAAAARQGGARP